ncbi:MAG TPA: hypothetical protein VFU02_18520 [Polyangiaceae bacterium]|nr:hypothetical protein [Polyangiaceae bacterium]
MLRATRDSRRLLSLVVLGIAILVAIRWLMPGDSSHQAVRRTLEQVLEDVAVRSGETPGRRDQRVQETLARNFADPVTVRYVDMPRTGAGRAALLLWARLLGAYQSAELSLVHFELAREADRALAKIDVRLEAQGSKGSISQERAVEVTLMRRADRWVIESVDVVRGAANLPEARP